VASAGLGSWRHKPSPPTEIDVKNPKQSASSAPTKSAHKQSAPSKPNPTQKEEMAAKDKPSAAPQDKPSQHKKSHGKTAGSKQDRVVEMLRRPAGVTVAAVMKATGWQKHSVHGFFAGVVRKKLGLNLTSEKTDGHRVYRVAEGKSRKGSKAGKTAKRAA
jgi:outer membrane biosynthesis protein TonB